MSRTNTGSVDEDSRVWLDAQVIKIDKNYSADKSTAGGVPEIGISAGSSHPKDYMMMTYEQRSIDIDQLQAPASHVITGVRFRNLGGHLNLEARVTTLFNFFIRKKAKLLRCGQTCQKYQISHDASKRSSRPTPHVGCVSDKDSSTAVNFSRRLFKKFHRCIHAE